MDVLDRSQLIDSQSESPPTSAGLEGQQVLLVEDCLEQSRLYLKYLQMAGAEVTLECNGQAAVDVIRKSPTLFDAVVMDFEMPEQDGLKSTRQIRELGYGGGIIAATAFGSEELKLSWFRAGCDVYLEKPINKHELVGAVRLHSTVAMETVGK